MLQNCGDKEEEKEHVGSSKGRTVARAAYFLSHAGVVHGVAAWYTLRLHKETKASISTAPGIKGRHWRQVLSSPALPPPQSPYVGKVQMAHAAVFLRAVRLPLPQASITARRLVFLCTDPSACQLRPLLLVFPGRPCFSWGRQTAGR